MNLMNQAELAQRFLIFLVPFKWEEKLSPNWPIPTSVCKLL